MTYALAGSLDQALKMLQSGTATIISGGTDFFPAQAKGATPQSIVDVSRIAEMKGISRTSDNGWRIGGATTWTDLIRADLPPAFDGLKDAAREVGSIQIQNAGTLAGNLCNASPAADGVPCLLALGASVELTCADGVRVVPLSSFLIGVRQTSLRTGEVMSAILIPPQSDHALGGFEKLGSRRYLVISITMVGAVVELDQDGVLAHARIAIGACSPVAQRQHALEQRLIGQRPADVTITPEDLENLSPIDDMRGDAPYRLQAVCVQIERLLHKAART